MRRRLHAGLVAVALVAAAATSYSYSTYSKWSSTPIFYVNPNNADMSASAAAAAVQFALNVWNTQGNSPFRFDYGGTNSDTSTANDGRNVVIFRNVSNGSTLATTYSWWDGSSRLVDSDVIVWDGGFTFFSGTSGCGGTNGAYLEDVLTHEFGHALGLNHSSVADATMYPSYGYCSQSMRTLASDDIAGLQSLYGVGSSGGTSGSGGGSSVPAITAPASGAALGGSSQTFTWTAGSGVTAYWLYVGTTAGSNNLFDLSLGTSLSATATGLPTNGSTVYVRLWWLLSGSWRFADYTYTAATTSGGSGGGTGTNPAITTPGAGGTLSGSSQTFSWSAGTNATSFWLYVGNTAGGSDLFNQSTGVNRTANVAGLPTDGRKIYARLWWVRNGAWEYADTTYTAAGAGTGGGGGGGTSSTNPAITTPSAGATLGSSQTFTWTPGTGIVRYWLYLGSSAGGSDLFFRDMGSGTSVTVGSLPSDGRTIYARLWWTRGVTWESADVSYKAPGS